MQRIEEDLKVLRDLAVKREFDSGAENRHWFAKEYWGMLRERGNPLLGLLAFALILSTEWEVSKIVAVAFWFLVIAVVVGTIVILSLRLFEFVMSTQPFRKIVIYGVSGWVLFHLIKFHF
jgi:hypothetical protein